MYDLIDSFQVYGEEEETHVSKLAGTLKVYIEAQQPGHVRPCQLLAFYQDRRMHAIEAPFMRVQQFE